MDKGICKTMAKYTRYDARNKKNSKHKRQSINKDLRIRRVDEDKSSKYDLKKLTGFKSKLYTEEDFF